MPTYQYACTVCGHQLEAVQSFTDEALTECPECAGRLRKQFSAVGVVFKGSGFYRTDSRAASSAGDTAKSGNGHNGSKPDTAKSESGKSESSTKTETSSAKKSSDATSAA